MSKLSWNWRFAIMLVLLFCLAQAAKADYVATNDAGDELRLMNGACDNEEVLAQLKPEYHSQFKRAQATISGKAYLGCWIAIPEEKAVYMQFQNGQGQVFSEAMFKEQGV
jgi:hypothetical protein